MTKKKKKTFYVYFSQINQMKYEVTAKDKYKAVEKAQKMWRQDYPGGPGGYVEEKP